MRSARWPWAPDIRAAITVVARDAGTGQVKLEFRRGIARLDGLDLTAAHLDGANLAYGSFKAADLSDASFKAADLRGARLAGANLTNVELFDAHLEGADLSEASNLLFEQIMCAHVNDATRLSSDVKRPAAGRPNGADCK